jgi:hypothetical protein
LWNRGSEANFDNLDASLNAVSGIDTTNPIANLTGVARNSERYLSSEETSLISLSSSSTDRTIISVERFSDTLAKTDCVNGHIQFTFKNPEAFDAARNWLWVNEMNRTLVIVLMTNVCDNPRRQPYRASRVTFDHSKLLAEACVEQSTWQDAVTQGRFRLNTEGILPGAIGSTTKNLTKRLSIPEKRHDAVDLTSDFSRQLFSKKIPGTDATAEVACKQCGTRGKLNIDIDIEIILLRPSKGTIQITPAGIGADVIFGIKANGEIQNTLSESISLPTVPLLGLHIPGVVDIGPEVRILAEAAIDSISASAEITFGAKLDVPEDSIVKFDLENGQNNQISGWVPVFTPVAPQFSGELTLHGHVGPRINLELDILVLGAGIGAGLSIGAPQLTIDLSASSNTAGGVCGRADVETGVVVDLGLGAELDAFAGVGKPQDLPGKIALFSTSRPLFSTCFPGSESTATMASVSSSSPPPSPTGSTTTFLNAACSPEQSGSNQFTIDACVSAGLNSEFQSGSITFPALDQGNGCLLGYFSDSACTNRVGPAFNPSSGQCITAAQLGTGAETVRFMKVSSCS